MYFLLTEIFQKGIDLRAVLVVTKYKVIFSQTRNSQLLRHFSFDSLSLSLLYTLMDKIARPRTFSL